MNGIVNWFVNTIKGVILWQIGVFTYDLGSMVLFTAAFDVLLLTFAALAIWGEPKLTTITRIAAVGMIIASLVLVALVGR